MVRLTNDIFLNRMKDINNNIEFLSEYINSKEYINCRCKICGYEWKSNGSNLLSGRGCVKCYHKRRADETRKTHTDFVNEMKRIDPQIKIIDKYVDAKTKINCLCLKHGQYFYASPTHLLQGKTGCKQCFCKKISSALIMSHEDFVLRMKEINPNIEVIGKYTLSHQKIKVKCKKCNHIWNPASGSLLSGFGCPKCKKSKGEETIINILNKYDIQYEYQKRYSNLRGVGNLPLSYDFYLPEYNTLIEYQGQFHDGTTNLSTPQSLKIQQEHDRRKADYAKDNNINLLSIWYYQYDNIEQILMNYVHSLKSPVTTTVA